MSETITVRGFVATYPELKHLPNGTAVANFRLASTPRWFDQASQTWKEGSTNWYTVNAYKTLAHNASRSLQVGQPVFVSGKLKIRAWEREDGTGGQSVEVDAQLLGHDLSLGTSIFQRNLTQAAASGQEGQARQQQGQQQVDQGVASQGHPAHHSASFGQAPLGSPQQGQDPHSGAQSQPDAQEGLGQQPTDTYPDLSLLGEADARQDVFA